ncbi:MAG: tetratricopeptide repeat protein [Kiritimatiellia bacterium]
MTNDAGGVVKEDRTPAQRSGTRTRETENGNEGVAKDANTDRNVRAPVAEGAASIEAVLATPLPAVVLAEHAYRDSLDDLAWSQAAKALFDASSPDPIRQRAFTVLMKVCERRLAPDAWLALLASGQIDDQALPAEDPALAPLKRYWLARAHVLAGQFAAAAVVLDNLGAALAPDDPLAESALRLQAHALGQAGRPEEAERLLATLAEPSADVLFDRGRLLIEAGRAADAAALLEPLVGDTNRVQEAAVAALLQARALDDTGGVTNALAVLATALAGPATNPDHMALALAASAMMRARETGDAQAVEIAERAVATAASPGVRLECQIELARTLARCGFAERAANEARALIAFAPTSPSVAIAVKALADVHVEAGRFAEALDLYTLFIASFADNPLEAAARRGQGLAFAGLKRYGEAANAFRSAAEQSPDLEAKRANLFNLAEAKRASGMPREALAVIEDLLELERSENASLNVSTGRGDIEPAARLLAAECLAELDPAAAAEAFIRVAADYPARAEAGRAFFRAAQILARSAEAMATPVGQAQVLGLYRRASEFPDPQLRAPSLLGMGLLALRAEKPDEALAAFEMAATVQNGGEASEQARFMKAEALLALGRVEEAVAAATALIDGTENGEWSREALFWLGRRQFNAGEYAKAEASFSDYARKWPASPRVDSALLLKAQAQFYLGKHSEAIETAAALTSAHPESRCVPIAQFTHAEALCELLQFDAALLLFDDVVKTARDDDLRLRAMGRRGDCFFTLGEDNAVRYAESVAAYEGVLAHPAPKSFETILQCQYKTGRSLEKAGRIDEAFQRYYQDVILMFEHEGGEAGLTPDSPSRIWYSRGVLGAAEILERRENWKAAAAMLARIATGNWPGAEEAARRLERIRRERLPAETAAGADGVIEWRRK